VIDTAAIDAEPEVVAYRKMLERNGREFVEAVAYGLRTGQIEVSRRPSVARNAPCPCGSTRKAKKCCYG
jgi:uncharacterized protein YecA (UPF0149 family)